MRKSVVIDSLPESVSRYQAGWAVVAVDVIRATTTAITAVATGRRCFPAPTIDAALALSQAFKDPLLAGESGGTIPVGFEIDNSPAELMSRTDIHRPLVLVSSSGTKVIHEAAGCDATYLSSFRNYSSLVPYLSEHHPRVAIIGAGSKGEFREEDQMCCAWLAAGLMNNGYLAEDAQTGLIASRWRDAPPNACLCSHSVDFLKRTGRLADLDFILSHIDDVRGVFAVRNREVKLIAEEQAISASSLARPAGLRKPLQPIAVQ
jgi:2-phosphosulfolactate phosphatase